MEAVVSTGTDFDLSMVKRMIEVHAEGPHDALEVFPTIDELTNELNNPNVVKALAFDGNTPIAYISLYLNTVEVPYLNRNKLEADSDYLSRLGAYSPFIITNPEIGQKQKVGALIRLVPGLAEYIFDDGIAFSMDASPDLNVKALRGIIDKDRKRRNYPDVANLVYREELSFVRQPLGPPASKLEETEITELGVDQDPTLAFTRMLGTASLLELCDVDPDRIVMIGDAQTVVGISEAKGIVTVIGGSLLDNVALSGLISALGVDYRRASVEVLVSRSADSGLNVVRYDTVCTITTKET